MDEVFYFKDMDYYKNIDKLGCDGTGKLTASGVQYRVVTDLAAEPVDLVFFKQHARIDFDTDDTLCAIYIKAARIALEQWSQLSFGVKTIGITALSLPKNYKLMFGKVDVIDTTGFTNKGDILKEGGIDIDIEFTTLNWIDDCIRIAIARYAAGLYINRENVTDTKYSSQALQDEAKTMLQPYRNLIIL